MPVNGQPSLSQMSTIAKGSVVNNINMNDSEVRFLIGVTTNLSQIAFSQAIGKPVSNTTSYASPGTYSWYVPAYQNLYVAVLGAGGGGGGGSTAFIGWYPGGSGGNGGYSQFQGGGDWVTGWGGGGGGSLPNGSPGSPGGAVNGWENITGGGAAGGAGGAGNGTGWSHPGGAGGRANKWWTHKVTANYPPWNIWINLIVGQGGYGGARSPQGGGNGSPGGNGLVYISWS